MTSCDPVPCVAALMEAGEVMLPAAARPSCLWGGRRALPQILSRREGALTRCHLPTSWFLVLGSWFLLSFSMRLRVEVEVSDQLTSSRRSGGKVGGGR